MSIQPLIDAVLRRAADDPAFRATAIHDPVAALAEVACQHNRTIRADHAERVTFVRTTDVVTPDDVTFVLPDVVGASEAETR